MSTIFVEFGGAANAQLSLSQWMKRAALAARCMEPASSLGGRVADLRHWCLVLARMAGSWPISVVSKRAARRWRPVACISRTRGARLTQLPSLRRDAAAAPVAASPRAHPRRGVPRTTCASSPNWPRKMASRCWQWNPACVSGAGVESMRPLQLTAHTDFVHLMAFLRGLSDLPVLIVPVDMTVKRDAAALSVSATLHVFSALRPASVEMLPRIVFADDSLDSDDDEESFSSIRSCRRRCGLPASCPMFRNCVWSDCCAIARAGWPCLIHRTALQPSSRDSELARSASRSWTRSASRSSKDGATRTLAMAEAS